VLNRPHGRADNYSLSHEGKTCSVAKDDGCALQKVQADAHLWTPLQYLTLGSDKGHAKVDFYADGVKAVNKTQTDTYRGLCEGRVDGLEDVC
jgi:hypothetical protein